MSDKPFNIINKEEETQAQSVIDIDKSLSLEEQIKGLIGSSDIFLFMKGTPDMPMCGFSANSVAILSQLGKSFKSFNILADDEIRQGLKEYSNWPTYPQLYFKGQLIGGNDIITEMFHNGELNQLFNQ
ncbi:Grx4 family monothiol glutaredoxin [Halobacteriovorax sp. GB3]|uniref:Grx4 family monothiol glutaredoxin n=1 Tax=Halobacteriovorax sp. GB3 TaxID=2719615 RepID=UPI002361544E|nr:Grx4 family monothiol glutaredoxin [Halobacteriovorax sp. GB3]MDD0853559.1 Grx4 family monothiol glutaredoxin [Halobacteriovorax sp. GB3]